MQILLYLILRRKTLSLQRHICIIRIIIHMRDFKLHGDIDSVYLRGAHVVQDGKVILEKTGKYIKRGKNQM